MKKFLAKCEKNLRKRVKKIVRLAIKDFYNYGYSTNEKPKELRTWVFNDLMQDADIEDATTLEITLKIYELLNIVKEVDLEMIHRIVVKNTNKKEELIV